MGGDDMCNKLINLKIKIFNIAKARGMDLVSSDKFKDGLECFVMKYAGTNDVISGEHTLYQWESIIKSGSMSYIEV